MIIETGKSKSGANIGIGLSILFIIYLTSYYNYLLFHSIAEVFSILIAFSIFIIGWNSRKYMKTTYFLFLGIVYLFVGLLDLLHTLAYSGMGVFLDFDANLPTQLWIAARYLEALSLLAAIIFVKKKFDYKLFFLLYSIIFALLIGVIFYWRIFPTCYVEGVGLTSFKIYSEYFINVILLISILIMIQRRTFFEKQIFIYLIISISFTILAETAFTFYISVFGFSNLVGHIFKIISFYFIYKAIIETGIKKPYNIVFRDLKLNETELLKHHTQLENLVKILEKSEKKYRQAYNRAGFYKDLLTHDIRNILNNILGRAQLCNIHVGNPEKLEELKKHINGIQDQMKRGGRLVSNISKLSSLEEEEIIIMKIEIQGILEKSIAYVKNAYQGRNIDIKVESVSKKLYIRANELLDDVFENILNNAIKYNENLAVEILVKLSKEKIENMNYIKMEILDNGIGIDDSRKNLIFQRGYNKGPNIKGMGIGLSLVKIIVKTYNGKLWIENRVKGDYTKGSNFIIVIPEAV